MFYFIMPDMERTGLAKILKMGKQLPITPATCLPKVLKMKTLIRQKYEVILKKSTWLRPQSFFYTDILLKMIETFVGDIFNE